MADEEETANEDSPEPQNIGIVKEEEKYVTLLITETETKSDSVKCEIAESESPNPQALGDILIPEETEGMRKGKNKLQSNISVVRSTCRPRSRDSRRCQKHFQKMIGEHEMKNEELEKKEGDLRQRLEMLECSMPAVMVWNIWRMAQGASIPNIHRVVEKQFQGFTSGSLPCSSTPSQHYDCRIRQVEAERKEAQRRADEARALWVEKEVSLEEQKKKLDEARKTQALHKERIEKLTAEIQELRKSREDEELRETNDGSCKTGECGEIRCKQMWLGDVASTTSVKSTDLECLARLQELAEAELCMKRHITDLERREETYMRTLQQADELWSKMESDAASTTSGLQEQLDQKTIANQQLANKVCELEDAIESMNKRLVDCRNELVKLEEIDRMDAIIGNDHDYARVADKDTIMDAKMDDTDTMTLLSDEDGVPCGSDMICGESDYSDTEGEPCESEFVCNDVVFSPTGIEDVSEKAKVIKKSVESKDLHVTEESPGDTEVAEKKIASRILQDPREEKSTNKSIDLKDQSKTEKSRETLVRDKVETGKADFEGKSVKKDDEILVPLTEFRSWLGISNQVEQKISECSNCSVNKDEMRKLSKAIRSYLQLEEDIKPQKTSEKRETIDEYKSEVKKEVSEIKQHETIPYESQHEIPHSHEYSDEEYQLAAESLPISSYNENPLEEIKQHKTIPYESQHEIPHSHEYSDEEYQVAIESLPIPSYNENPLEEIKQHKTIPYESQHEIPHSHEYSDEEYQVAIESLPIPSYNENSLEEKEEAAEMQAQKTGAPTVIGKLSIEKIIQDSNVVDERHDERGTAEFDSAEKSEMQNEEKKLSESSYLRSDVLKYDEAIEQEVVLDKKQVEPVIAEKEEAKEISNDDQVSAAKKEEEMMDTIPEEKKISKEPLSEIQGELAVIRELPEETIVSGEESQVQEDETEMIIEDLVISPTEKVDKIVTQEEFEKGVKDEEGKGTIEAKKEEENIKLERKENTEFEGEDKKETQLEEKKEKEKEEKETSVLLSEEKLELDIRKKESKEKVSEITKTDSKLMCPPKEVSVEGEKSEKELPAEAPISEEKFEKSPSQIYPKEKRKDLTLLKEKICLCKNEDTSREEPRRRSKIIIIKRIICSRSNKFKSQLQGEDSPERNIEKTKVSYIKVKDELTGTVASVGLQTENKAKKERSSSRKRIVQSYISNTTEGEEVVGSVPTLNSSCIELDQSRQIQKKVLKKYKTPRESESRCFKCQKVISSKEDVLINEDSKTEMKSKIQSEEKVITCEEKKFDSSKVTCCRCPSDIFKELKLSSHIKKLHAISQEKKDQGCVAKTVGSKRKYKEERKRSESGSNLEQSKKSLESHLQSECDSCLCFSQTHSLQTHTSQLLTEPSSNCTCVTEESCASDEKCSKEKE